uniref:Uncharacterized protein n=1 Tax=Arundo donax TaxID=35708 RepID=A0A0A9BYX8_ARUDO
MPSGIKVTFSTRVRTRFTCPSLAGGASSSLWSATIDQPFSIFYRGEPAVLELR